MGQAPTHRGQVPRPRVSTLTLQQFLDAYPRIAGADGEGEGEGEGSNGGQEGSGAGGQQQQTKTYDENTVKELRGEAAKYRTELQSTRQKLQEFEDAKKTDLEKAIGERDQLKAQSETAAQQNARLRVALKKGLTGDRAELADLLQGKDEKELEAHADKLLKLMGATSATSFDGGARGTAETTDMDALIRRAAGRT